MTSDLTWLASTIPKSIGVHIVGTGLWSDDDADIVFRTDAALHLALAFVYAGKGFVYPIKAPPPSVKVDIFFLELMAIVSAIFHAASMENPPRRVLIFTDSLDSVQSFNSLSASESIHNGPLLAAADIILRSGIDIHVRFIEGKKNIRADMLSRLLLDDYSRLFPSDHVRLFSPPRDLLPARWRECF